ncbi:MAG: helix-turn-helix domain-containing protein [Treponema sp.]|nr:helix-turn-helix domain-containing protein [Treponema sp.]
MLKDNIINLRNAYGYSQEEVSEKIGISRQAYAKWEKGETSPDIEKCAQLAKIYNTSIDNLYFQQEPIEGFESLSQELPPAPKGHHIFGTVTMNEQGQIHIPKEAQDLMGYKPGEKLLVLGDEQSGLALMRTKDFIKSALSAIKAARTQKD